MHTIDIEMDGGIIQNITNIPPGTADDFPINPDFPVQENRP